MKRLAGAALAATLALAGPAIAAPGQESFFMDDNELVYGSAEKVETTFAIMRNLGVDRARVTVEWALVAPAPRSRTRPEFPAGGASDPAAYPSGTWNRFDRLVDAGRRYGIAIHFTVTAPGPLWASSRPAAERGSHEPDPAGFRAFVTAVGRRYAGTYSDEQPRPAPPPCSFPLLFPCPDAPPAPPPRILPRVSFWSIQNEPNHPSWLYPQARRVRGRTVPNSPRLFRALTDAGWAGLQDSGHGTDTILIGETAPRGADFLDPERTLQPLRFVRDVYCLGPRLRPLAGATARAQACPTDAAGRERFAAAHPALFKATGWAHHPYGLDAAPAARDPRPDQVTIGVLNRLPRTLDRALAAWGAPRRLPIWITEYGYQTNPPDPVIGTSWRNQAGWINDAEFIAYRNPRVRSMAQFLLIDDKPKAGVPPSSDDYWGSTFQSGLVTLAGRRKPAYTSYQRPIALDRARVRKGARVRVFAQLRPAAPRAALSARLEFKARGAGRWTLVKPLSTATLRNTLVATTPVRGAGAFRVVWANPAGGAELPTRAAAVSLRR